MDIRPFAAPRLPPWYDALYSLAVESTAVCAEQRPVAATAATPGPRTDDNSAPDVPATVDDFHRLFNLLALWVYGGEPGVAGPDAEGTATREAVGDEHQPVPAPPSAEPVGEGGAGPALTTTADSEHTETASRSAAPVASTDASVHPKLPLPDEALAWRELPGSRLAELPSVRARCAFLRFVVAYNRGTVPRRYWLFKPSQQQQGRHHRPHPTADVPPPLGLTCSYEWPFARSREGLALAQQADQAFAHASFALSQRTWADLAALPPIGSA